jgi:hypothetical protein
MQEHTKQHTPTTHKTAHPTTNKTAQPNKTQNNTTQQHTKPHTPTTHKTSQPKFFKFYSILSTSRISRKIHSDMKQSINLSFPNMTARYRKRCKFL